MLISGISLIALTNFTGNAIPLKTIPWQSWASIAYLVIFGSLIAFICYLYALQNLPTEQASIYAYINPIVAVIFGWLLLNEKLSVFIGIGGLVTLLGVYLVNKAYKHSYSRTTGNRRYLKNFFHELCIHFSPAFE